MRRVPGSIINGGGGVVIPIATGQNAYQARSLYWANPVIWDASRYTRVTIDLWPGTFPTMPIRIDGARDGDRLIFDFQQSGWGGVVTDVNLLGVNIGAASLQERLIAAFPSSFAYPTWWTMGLYFLMKTRGQLYLTRVASKYNISLE